MKKNKINDLRYNKKLQSSFTKYKSSNPSSKLKGMSMPIEMIVIIAIVILVLVVMVAFFILNWGKSGTQISDTAALYEGCTKLVTTYSCDKTKMGSITIHDYSGTLLDACQKNGYTQDSCFTLVCKCTG